MESRAGFSRGGSGVASGSRRAAGTNEKRGEGFVEGRGIGNGKQDCKGSICCSLGNGYGSESSAPPSAASS